jgi:hypothetical protein
VYTGQINKYFLRYFIQCSILFSVWFKQVLTVLVRMEVFMFKSIIL